MDRPLEFKDFAINNRKYYTADFVLNKSECNLSHKHNFYEFFVVMKGEFIETFNQQTITLPKRYVHFVKPTDQHNFMVRNQYNINVLRNIAIEKQFFESLLNEIGCTDTHLLFQPFQIDEAMYESYKIKTEIMLQMSQTEETNLFLLKSILYDFMIYALLNKATQTTIPKWLQKAYTQFNKEDNYKKGLPYLIELSGKTQEHLTREFKKHYGITPTDYINSKKLQAAASMLRTTREKIIDIIYDCGFENVSYFNRLFKAKFGVKPREYRDQNKNIFKISI